MELSNLSFKTVDQNLPVIFETLLNISENDTIIDLDANTLLKSIVTFEFIFV